MNRNNSYLIGNKFAQGSKPNHTSFKPGMSPWNKGIKKITSEKCRATCFKKGQRGPRTLPPGAITVRIDTGGNGRRWIKIGMTGDTSKDWRIYASWLWEQKHGPIADGMFVHHLDGNSLNDVLSNYALTTRSAHIAQHKSQLISARKRDGTKVGKGYICAA